MKEVGNLTEIRYVKALEARCVYNFIYLSVLEFLLRKENSKLIKKVKSTVLYTTTNECLK